MKIVRFKPKNLQAVNSLLDSEIKNIKRKKSLFFKILKLLNLKK
jgi:hypothetical protein